MDEEVFEYEIGGKTYIQRKLVLGQIRQLMAILDGLKVDMGMSTLDLVAALTDRLPRALAVVLTPEGVAPREKDIAKLAEEIEFEIDPETTLRVVEDFFDCNPVQDLALGLRVLGAKLEKRAGLSRGSTSSSASSPTEISPAATPSSGDSRQRNADPTSATA